MTKINYRKDQIPIMNYECGTMAVPAVPGAGKTFIVTNLVAKLLEENKNEKGKILILTYMNSAANNFKGRIKKILEEKGIESTNGFEVMTIHSLAAKIIKEKPEAMMLSEDFNIADDFQKTMMLNDCINTFRASGGETAFRFFLKEQKNQMWYDIQLEAWENGFFELVSKSISNLKYNDISPQSLEANTLSNKGILKIISFIYTEYDKRLKQNGLLDYDDLLILKIENPALYMIDGEEYDHIMIINNEILEPYYKIESGYYRFKDGHVESFKNLDIQERTTYRGFADAEKYIVIGVQEHCSIISENDQWIEQLQEHETLSPEIMRDLQKNISKNKTYNVRLGI